MVRLSWKKPTILPCQSTLAAPRCKDLRQRYWWPYMKQDIARFVSQCDVCSRVKAGHQKPAGWLRPIPPPDWKWDKVEMDFITGFPKSQKGNDAIFVLIERFSMVAHFLPIKEA